MGENRRAYRLTLPARAVEPGQKLRNIFRKRSRISQNTRRLFQQFFQLCLPFFDRQTLKVLAVELEQIESVEEELEAAPVDLGNISALCLLASTKARSLNFMAESEPALAKSF